MDRILASHRALAREGAGVREGARARGRRRARSSSRRPPLALPRILGAMQAAQRQALRREPTYRARPHDAPARADGRPPHPPQTPPRGGKRTALGAPIPAQYRDPEPLPGPLLGFFSSRAGIFLTPIATLEALALGLSGPCPSLTCTARGRSAGSRRCRSCARARLLRARPVARPVRRSR